MDRASGPNHNSPQPPYRPAKLLLSLAAMGGIAYMISHQEALRSYFAPLKGRVTPPPQPLAALPQPGATPSSISSASPAPMPVPKMQAPSPLPSQPRNTQTPIALPKAAATSSPHTLPPSGATASSIPSASSPPTPVPKMQVPSSPLPSQPKDTQAPIALPKAAVTSNTLPPSGAASSATSSVLPKAVTAPKKEVPSARLIVSASSSVPKPLPEVDFKIGSLPVELAQGIEPSIEEVLQSVITQIKANQPSGRVYHLKDANGQSLRFGVIVSREPAKLILYTPGRQVHLRHTTAPITLSPTPLPCPVEGFTIYFEKGDHPLKTPLDKVLTEIGFYYFGKIRAMDAFVGSLDQINKLVIVASTPA